MATSGSRPRSTGFRASAAAAFTVALAVGAHGLAGGGAPGGGTAVLLLVLAGGVAALVGTWPRAGDRAPLLAVLAAGQLLGHLILDVGMHHPAAAGAMPSVAMALAHVMAVLLGALLIAGSDRLYRAVSSVIKRRWRTPCLPVSVRRPTVALRDEPPAQRLLMLATSISHRGPPAFAR